MLSSVAFALDRLGFRRLVAAVASIAYPGRRFTVDADGCWVNCQVGGTIVSPAIHTQSLASTRAIVLDHWCYRYTPKAGDIVLDVGAGIGEEAVVMSPLVGPGGRIVSIEAQPTVFRCLERTIALSQLANVRAIHCAVADKPGTARISDDHIASSILSGEGSEVPQRMIDEIAADLPAIDLLRMNIEGAEKLAIHAIPWAKVRNAVISCHDFAGIPSKAEVLEVLQQQGFEVTTRAAPEGMPWLRDYLYASQVESQPARTSDQRIVP
jgi:FkbM family methyltransferase